MAMPTADNTPNSEVISTSLHEIPLSNDEPEEQAPGSIEKIPSKSSSLKRFFKLGLNKKSSNEGNINIENVENGNAEAGAEAEATDADTEEGNEEVPAKFEREIESQGSQKDNTEEMKRSRSRRFNFRFHGSTVESDTPSSSGQPPNMSRHSLRGSLSTYFNAVFKRKQNANSKHSLRFSKKKDANKINDQEAEPETSNVANQHQVIEESDVQRQTAEIINDVEIMTISEQNNTTAITAVPTTQE